MVIWKITVGNELNDKRVLGLGITFNEYSHRHLGSRSYASSDLESPSDEYSSTASSGKLLPAHRFRGSNK